MSDVIEMEDIVETMEGDLATVTGNPSDSTGDTTVVEDGTCNGGEGRVGESDGEEGVGDAETETETDTVAVGVGEGDEDEEYVIDGDSLEGLSSIVLSRLGSREV